MRKIIVLAILVGGLVGLLRPSAASAQTTASVYAVKFVCGLQGPPAFFLPPIEAAVKPGNYATKISVELLSQPCLSTNAISANATMMCSGEQVAWKVSLAGQTQSASASTPSIVLAQLQTADITCEDIVGRAFPSGSPTKFIYGYVNLIAATTATLAVNAVYTSQGCSFGQSGNSQGAPSCSGPVSIEVVPEQGAQVTFP